MLYYTLFFNIFMMSIIEHVSTITRHHQLVRGCIHSRFDDILEVSPSLHALC